MSWAGHWVRMGDGRGASRVLVRRPEGTRPLRKAWRRWKDNIKVDLQELEWSIDWIELTLDGDRWGAHVNVVISCWVFLD